jgi:hypothetical protein
MPPKRVESAVIRDPGVAHGRFRPLPRTDGKYIVYDPDQPLGRGTVGNRTFTTLALADAFARECAAAPPPIQEPAECLDVDDPAHTLKRSPRA